MLGYFSPFRHIVRSKHIINDVQGKVLQQTFWQKLKATYEVFAGYGGTMINDLKAHVGILEYPTLLIGPAIRQAMFRLNLPLRMFWLFHVLTFVCQVSYLLISIPIVLMAIACTILVSPIVLIVHLFSKGKGEKLRENALLTEIAFCSHQRENTLTRKMQCALYNVVSTENTYEFAARDLDVFLEDLGGAAINHSQESEHKVSITYKFFLYYSFLRNGKQISRGEETNYPPRQLHPIDLTLDLTQDDDRLIFESLVSLNAGGLKNACQDDGIDPAQLISNAKTAAPA